MRRGASISVLLVLMTALLAPLAQGSGPSLPACCRADGSHHCAMMGLGGDGFRVQPSACPYKTWPAISGVTAAVVGGAIRIAPALTGDAAVFQVSIANGQILSGNSRLRGPPTV